MTEHDLLKARWDEIVKRLSDTFSEGEPLQVDTIIYLIGVQELPPLKAGEQTILMKKAIVQYFLDRDFF